MVPGPVLALDYGDQRIGLAVTDPERRYALSRGVIPAQPQADAVEALTRLIAEERVVELVLGLPRTLEGTEGEQARKTRAFAQAVESAVRLPVTFVDERFTTALAERLAREKGTAPDAEAARLILEAWLAGHQS